MLGREGEKLWGYQVGKFWASGGIPERRSFRRDGVNGMTVHRQGHRQNDRAGAATITACAFSR